MKFILNKKNISVIVYIILALLLTNVIDNYRWDKQYTFEWLEIELIPTNYKLAYKVREKAGITDFDNYRYFFNESITDEQLSNILNNNDSIFSDTYILDDPNIKYIIKDHETNTTITNTTDITSISEKNYDDYYLYFITFIFDENGHLSYNTSEDNHFDWYDTLSSYKSNYFEDKGFDIDSKVNNSSLYTADLNNLKNMTITYAITIDLTSNCTSYNELYPFRKLQNYAYNELVTYLLVIAVIGFIIAYDKIWMYKVLKNNQPFYSFSCLSIIFVVFYTEIFSDSLRDYYNTKETIRLFLVICIVFYLTHLMITYIRYLFDTYKPITKIKHWIDKNIPIKYSLLDNDAIDINEVAKHMNISKATKYSFLFTSILTFIIVLFSCIIMSFIGSGFVLLLIFCLFICLYLICYKYLNDYFIQYDKLLNVIKQVSNGYFDSDLEELTYFNDIQNEFSHIKDGFEKAVLEEVKSERMKTELITNVSHDLKTPLTSIITYIDLLKKENCLEDHKNYVDILEKSSFRLKRLIEDLFEVSKASSGNIELNIESIDIVSLMKQVLFEYQDKLEINNLTIKENYTKDKYILELDSLKTFRIFENLINNTIKYAMPNTRIYIDIEDDEYFVIITIKNISYQEINFNGDEIVERFVRGDKSRNTTGSGLGLAIVKSFTEIQNGEFKVKVDGDLFKAIVKFKK